MINLINIINLNRKTILIYTNARELHNNNYLWQYIHGYKKNNKVHSDTSFGGNECQCHADESTVSMVLSTDYRWNYRFIYYNCARPYNIYLNLLVGMLLLYIFYHNKCNVTLYDELLALRVFSKSRFYEKGRIPYIIFN